MANPVQAMCVKSEGWLQAAERIYTGGRPRCVSAQDSPSAVHPNKENNNMKKLRGLKPDAYDRTSFEEFVGIKKKKPNRKQRFATRRERQEAKELADTQRTGKSSAAAWWRRYYAYINSPRWRGLKERLLRERGVNCERCGKFKPLDLHHLTYVRLGNEDDEDLKLYCRDCHDLMHPQHLRKHN
jgi:hypothetical protein